MLQSTSYPEFLEAWQDACGYIAKGAGNFHTLLGQKLSIPGLHIRMMKGSANAYERLSGLKGKTFTQRSYYEMAFVYQPKAQEYIREGKMGSESNGDGIVDDGKILKHYISLSWQEVFATVFPYEEMPEIKEFIVTHLKGLSQKAIAVDLGGGDSQFFSEIREALGHRGPAINIDLSLTVLKWSLKKRIWPVLADIESIPLKPKSAHLILSTFVLEYLQQPEEALRQIRSTLKANGKAVFLFYHPDSWITKNMKSGMELNKRKIELLTKAINALRQPADENKKEYLDISKKVQLGADMVPGDTKELTIKITSLNRAIRYYNKPDEEVFYEGRMAALKDLLPILEADLAESKQDLILTKTFCKNVLSSQEWIDKLQDAGFVIEEQEEFPMSLVTRNIPMAFGVVAKNPAGWIRWLRFISANSSGKRGIPLKRFLETIEKGAMKIIDRVKEIISKLGSLGKGEVTSEVQSAAAASQLVDSTVDING